MERSKAGTKERGPDGQSLTNQNTILINIRWYYVTRYVKSTMKFILLIIIIIIIIIGEKV